MGFGFTKKGQKMEFPVPPAVRILIDGNTLQMPAHPVWATEENGLMDNSTYEVKLPAGVTGGTISVDAPDNVDVDIDAEALIVRCTYRGKTKSFILR